MDDKQLIGGIFLLALLLLGISFILPYLGDGISAEDIYIDGFSANVEDTSDDFPNGINMNDYMYIAHYIVNNVSSSINNAEVVTYFYSNDNLILDNRSSSVCNNSTKLINGSPYEFNHHSSGISAYLHSDTFSELTHVVIMIIDDGKVIFNETRNVTINNAEKIKYIDEDSNSDDTSNSKFSSNYVASSNSNKFHEPSCTQAKRINDENKITFSSRDEAVNAGYESCDICYP